MKKIITAVLAVTMAVGVLTGCGSGTGKKEASGEKLVIWTNMNVEVDTIQKYADEWGEKNGRKVEVIHQSPSVQQFAQAVKSASGPDAVVGIPNDQLADYVNADLTAEVPQDLYADQDFSDAAIQACYVDGKRYAAPLSVETTALFYNTDLVSEVPKTWEELVDQAAADGGVQFDATSIYYDLGFVRACGGYIFKYQDGAYDTADIGLDNEGSVDAYAFINDLCNKYKLITADVTADIARSNFQNGKCAYYIGGPWDIDGFTSAYLLQAPCLQRSASRSFLRNPEHLPEFRAGTRYRRYSRYEPSSASDVPGLRYAYLRYLHPADDIHAVLHEACNPVRHEYP